MLQPYAETNNKKNKYSLIKPHLLPRIYNVKNEILIILNQMHYKRKINIGHFT